MNMIFQPSYTLAMLVLVTAGCSNQSFDASSAPKKGAVASPSPRPVVGSDGTIQYSPDPENSPIPTPSTGATPTGTTTATPTSTPGSSTTPSAPTPTPTATAVQTATPSPSIPPPFELINGIPILNVALGKIQITMTIDHVTDLVITETELYAVHHELAIPTIGSIILYDSAGNVIDTRNWKIDWGNCPTHPTSDANCASSRLRLNAGHTMRGIATKSSGRGDLLKMSSDPFTVRILDCGRDCSEYGGKGRSWSSVDTYVWTME